MNKDYAEYRLNHFARYFAGYSFRAGDDGTLRRNYEEVDGRFKPTEAWEFDLAYTFPNAPGIMFSQSSEPFMLHSLTKEKLDAIFRETFVKLTKSLHEHVILNIREGTS